ncbi:MAG: zf-HC2 domain-containing protein [Deltaproteobacteria bacterium]|nr:zf-HC2 domain-containing protein [Deltaproteobacteria bacterium]
MRCSKARKLFSPYIDKTLTESETEMFEAHIGACTQCRSGLEQTLAVHAAFGSLEPVRAPYGFATRVMTGLEEKREERWSLFPVLGRIIEAAVVLVIIIIGTRAGSFLGTALNRQQTTIASSLSLDTFASVQPDSVGGAYMTMMGVTNEK